MALKYVVKKTVFGFDQTKTVKYVARPLLAGTVDYSDFCSQVAKMGIVSRGMVEMVLDSTFNVLERNLSDHLSVKLGDFGTFRPAFGSKSQNSKEAVNAEALRHRKVIFTPSGHFKEMLRTVDIHKCEIHNVDDVSFEERDSKDFPEI